MPIQSKFVFTICSRILIILWLLFLWGESMTLPTYARPVREPLLGFTALAAGGEHTCGLTNSGGVKCWGRNNTGQAGDGSSLDRLLPVDVIGLDSRVITLVAGGAHTCALTEGGGVKCWGSNYTGQLGDGTTTNRFTPVAVNGLNSGVIALAAGGAYTCALTGNGAVKCWGNNGWGQLGDGTTTDRLTPVAVSSLNSGVITLAAGSRHICALTGSGTVKCWGNNYWGQLGDNTTIDRFTPVNVKGLGSDIIALAAGVGHTCVLTSSRDVKCWGSNHTGQLGDGTTTQHLTPVNVNGLSSDVIALTAGMAHTCALTGSGRLSCWGYNESGLLGDGTTTIRLTPVEVSGLSEGVTAVTAGFYHTCALMDEGGAKCWGSNATGQLGNGIPMYQSAPVPVNNLSSEVISLAAGFRYSCALTSGGGVQCWGENDCGQLGDGTTTDRLTPVAVNGLESGVTALAAGGYHVCALTSDRAIKCWGYNATGQLGDGTTTDRLTPVAVSGLENEVIALAADGYDTCALTSNGGVKCWGDNYYGQLGNDTTINSSTPVEVSGLSSGVIALAAGGGRTCAVTEGGGVKCWGANYYGQLGDGTTTERHTPVAVIGLSSGITALTMGGGHSCALTNSGGVQCWGLNENGEPFLPMEVSDLSNGVVALTSGELHTCALTEGGGVNCWGGNDRGQLGDGTIINRASPVNVIGLNSGTTAVAAGGWHTCAVTDSAGVKCWGDNFAGQLGNALTPVDVMVNHASQTSVLYLPLVRKRMP